MLPVSAHLELRLMQSPHSGVPVSATLLYDFNEPYAIDAEFHTADGDVTWVFGRDLLNAGLTTPTGEGDVAIWPSTQQGTSVLCLSLDSPSGSAVLEAELAEVAAFLDVTFSLVPAGTEMEFLDLDAELAQLLGDGTSPHA